MPRKGGKNEYEKTICIFSNFIIYHYGFCICK